MDQLREMKVKAKHVLEPTTWREIVDILIASPQQWILAAREGVEPHVRYLHERGIHTVTEPYGVRDDGTILMTIWAMWPGGSEVFPR